MTCPKSADAGGGPVPLDAASARSRAAACASEPVARCAITSKGADAKLAADLNPLTGAGGDLCPTHKPDRRNSGASSRAARPA